MAAQGLAQDLEDVAFAARDALAFRDGDCASASHDAFERSEADEGVAAYLFAVLDGLKKEAFTRCPCGAQKGGDRRFKVRGKGAANGHKGVLFG